MDQHLEKKIRAMEQAIRDRDEGFAMIAKVVVRPTETVTPAEVIRRVNAMAAALIHREQQQGALENAVRALGPCDLDAVGACHAHVHQGECPIGVCLGLCRRKLPSLTTVPTKTVTA